MKLLLVGSTGLLGQAIESEARSRNWQVRTVARRGADIALDIADLAELDVVLGAEAPDWVVNCAALVDVLQCENDPARAYLVNARPVAQLAAWSRRTGGRLIQISTDHYHVGGGGAAHGEDEPVELVNEYARTKFAAESFALTAPRALVLRTSIVGIRGWERPTFAEWAIEAVLGTTPFDMFADAYTSSIDVGNFARAALHLGLGSAAGLFNLAAKEVYTKAAFVREIAAQLDRRLDHGRETSVNAMLPRRPASLGLDVGRVQAHLDFALPDLRQVATAVLDVYRERIGT